MSIKNSINFLRTAMYNNQFRAELNQLAPDDVFTCIKDYGFDFTAAELEESINLMHVKCQFEEEATQLFETVTWYQILTSQN